VKVGDKRVVFPWIGCGSCSLCADGREHLCNRPQTLGIQRDGGFSSHVVVQIDDYRVVASPIKMGRTPASYRLKPPAREA